MKIILTKKEIFKTKKKLIENHQIKKKIKIIVKYLVYNSILFLKRKSECGYVGEKKVGFDFRL